MKKQCNSPFDRISNLPRYISQIILMFLPVRDMARTSILSKHWRYQWVHVPQLVFKDDCKYYESREEKYRYNAMKVLEILFQHHGPLLKLTLDMTAWLDYSAIHKIIPVLSRNGIKELTLYMPKGGCYTLPSSILSCVELIHLKLVQCVFQPLTIVGFSKLVSLNLTRVKLDADLSISSCPLLQSLVLDFHFHTIVNLLNIDAPILKMLHLGGTISQIGVMNTPLLKDLWLSSGDASFTGNSSFDLIRFLHSLPLLEELRLSCRFLQVLAIGDSTNKFLKPLNNLLTLEVIAYLRVMDEVFWFIRSSPNIQNLKIRLRGTTSSSPIEANLCLKMQKHFNYLLLKLQVVELVLSSPCDLKHVVEFSKFLLGISPVLRTLYVKVDSKLIDVNGYKMLVELACYPRVSPTAKIVYVGLESLNLIIA